MYFNEILATLKSIIISYKLEYWKVKVQGLLMMIFLLRDLADMRASKPGHIAYTVVLMKAQEVCSTLIIMY